jgi:hypothetical protein
MYGVNKYFPLPMRLSGYLSRGVLLFLCYKELLSCADCSRKSSRVLKGVSVYHDLIIVRICIDSADDETIPDDFVLRSTPNTGRLKCELA